MFTIDRLTAADAPDAVRLSTSAGWNQVGDDWRRLIELWPGTCLAGRLAGGLVASATLAVYPASDAAGSMGWVGMVLVDPAHRGRGFGRAMMEAVLEAGGRAGVGLFGLDATDLGRPMYHRLGFRDAGSIERWTGRLRTREGPLVTHAAVRRLAPFEVHSLSPPDRQATGVDRTTLLRQLASESAVRTEVAIGPGGGLAFGMRRPGRKSAQVGPLVGGSLDAACAVLDSLLQPALPELTGQEVVLDVPAGSPLRDALAERGFVVTRRLTRMYRPPPSAPAPLTGPGVFAACGLELG